MPPSPSGNSGFTLLETLVVLAIAVVALVVGLNSFPRPGSRQILERSAFEIASVMRRAQLAALRTGQRSEFTFELDAKRYWFAADQKHDLESGIVVTMLNARDNRSASPLGRIRFLPSGQCTGATITLAREVYSIEVTADWLTGAIGVRWRE
jgi:prepilin-type N-terminal cleavage/methylation domain-containing protein